jgi:hypothetical protein
MLFWTFIVERNQNLNNQFSRAENQASMSALPPKADMRDAKTDVRFGSLADMAASNLDVRFYPESGH